MKIREILNNKGHQVATIHPQATIAQLADKLNQTHYGALIVTTKGGTLLGIASERDIIRALASGATALELTVEEIMTTNLVTLQSTDDVETAMNHMTENRIRHIPIIDNGQLTGIISIGDVVKTRVDELEFENTHMTDYIQGKDKTTQLV